MDGYANRSLVRDALAGMWVYYCFEQGYDQAEPSTETCILDGM